MQAKTGGMIQKLSRRLQAAADFVTPGSRMADVGTDHGHLPIYLVQCGRCPCAVAMDIRSGPLQRADEHIRAAGLTDSIQTRLSDGMKELKQKEADSVVIAGMGGLTVIQILEASSGIVQDVKELILAPQSDIAKVRRFLREHGMLIDRENLVLEDGKFYPVLHVVNKGTGTYEAADKGGYKKIQQLLYEKLRSAGSACTKQGKQHMPDAGEQMQNTQSAAGQHRQMIDEQESGGSEHIIQMADDQKREDLEHIMRIMDQYGACLVCERHPVLREMLERDSRQKQKILRALESSARRDESMQRRREVEEQLRDIELILEIIDSEI